MLKEGKFGYHEAISMIVILIVVRVFFSSPAKVTELVGPSGWYLTLISAAVAAAMFSFVYLLLKRFPYKNLMQINDIVLGKVLGSAASFLLGAFLLVVAGMNMREFSEILKIYVLPENPPSFIMVMFIISVLTLSFMGLETIARFAKFMVYILAAGYLLVIALSYPNFEFYRLFPILGYGLDKTIINGFLRSSFYGDVIVIGVFALSLHGPKQIKKIGYSSLLIAGLATSLSIIAFSMVFPYTTGQELTSQMYAMVATIDLGAFIERLDPIFVFLWNFGSFIEVSILFYSSLMIFCHIFKITDKRPLILPLGTVMYCINLIPKGIAEVTSGVVQIIRSYGWVLYFTPSIFVLLVALIRKKKGESIHA